MAYEKNFKGFLDIFKQRLWTKVRSERALHARKFLSLWLSYTFCSMTPDVNCDINSLHIREK